MASDLFTTLRGSELCGDELRETTTTLRFEIDRVIVTITDVPAAECPGIEEKIVPGPLSIALSEFAQKVADAARLLQEAELTNSDEPIETTTRYPHSNEPPLVPA